MLRPRDGRVRLKRTPREIVKRHSLAMITQVEKRGNERAQRRQHERREVGEYAKLKPSRA